MWYLAAAVAGIVLAIIGNLWYNARSTAVAENNEAAEKAARAEAEKKAEALEAQRAAEWAEAEKKDKDEATAVDGDARRAAEFLRDSFGN